KLDLPEGGWASEEILDAAVARSVHVPTPTTTLSGRALPFAGVEFPIGDDVARFEPNTSDYLTLRYPRSDG
ncbi:MAG: hypothetical protein JWR83_1262, partial [Aeromicrobium sp.]|nr:hypothetical protein [Aeromicrobium sp.]